MNSNKIDIIGIGAINFDYIFSSHRADTKSLQGIDDGEETFVEKHEFERNLHMMQERVNSTFQTQIGGSALLAIRTVKGMCPHLNTAYVGVYGNITKFMPESDLPKNSNEMKKCLSEFVDEMSWVFEDNTDELGCALVKLKNKKRQHINVYPGANNNLLKYIKNKGTQEFIGFLASAKWIHMTSLADVNQFVQIADYVHQAKKINPCLTVSIDPGFDYTKRHWNTLKTIFQIADYIFLSRIELNNLSNNLGLRSSIKYIDLGDELVRSKSNAQIMVIKNKGCTVLLSMQDGLPFTRKYYHKMLLLTQTKNDTGAGDAFAGGFIAGQLNPVMLSYQPASVRLGAIAARERLKSPVWPTTLTTVAHDFFRKNMKQESRNIKDFINTYMVGISTHVLSFIIGVILTLIILTSIN